MTASGATSRWGTPSECTLTELEAFDAMRLFIEAFWRRGNCESEELRNLLSFTDRTPWPNGKQLPHLAGAPCDIAQWEDWLDAVAKVKAAQPSKL
jgi:hypothetical protein